MVQSIVTLTNHVIDRAGFTLRGAFGTLEIFAKASCKYVKTKKKVMPCESGAPRAVPFGKFAPGYCITSIKRLDESLR